MPGDLDRAPLPVELLLGDRDLVLIQPQREIGLGHLCRQRHRGIAVRPDRGIGARDRRLDAAPAAAEQIELPA